MTTREHLVNKRKAFLALAIAAAVVVSACSGSESEGSTTEPTTASDTTPTVESLPTDLPDLEFGKGEMPITVPSNFPMPQQTLISTTMIDGTRELTEVVFNIAGNIHDVKEFFTVNLPRFGYEITDVADRTNETTVSFIGNGIDGEVALKVVGGDVTTGILVFVYAS
jgi:hypothetical protein